MLIKNRANASVFKHITLAKHVITILSLPQFKNIMNINAFLGLQKHENNFIYITYDIESNFYMDKI